MASAVQIDLDPQGMGQMKTHGAPAAQTVYTQTYMHEVHACICISDTARQPEQHCSHIANQASISDSSLLKDVATPCCECLPQFEILS